MVGVGREVKLSLAERANRGGSIGWRKRIGADIALEAPSESRDI